MQVLEDRIKYLEKRVGFLNKVIVLTCILLVSFVFFRAFELELGTQASAQGGFVIEASKVPALIEAQSFVLKDRDGNIRGMWSADDASTTLASAYKGQLPAVVIKVDKKDAFVSVNGSDNNKAVLGIDEQTGESYLDVSSKKMARIGMVGDDVLLETLGNLSDIVIAETSGSYVNIASTQNLSKISFVDSADNENILLEHIGGESILKLISPIVNGMQIIKALPGELQSLNKSGTTRQIKVKQK